MGIIFYHNPNCSKSRAVHQLLQDQNVDFSTIEYLEEGFTEAQLRNLMHHLDQPATALVRTNNELFRSLSIDDNELNEDAVIALLIKHPELFQRPVVLNNQNARIGRPPERVKEIL